MSDELSLQFSTAADKQDAKQLRGLILNTDFVMIRVGDENGEDDESLGALTANVEDFDVLVAFTNEKIAGGFVSQMGDIFEEDEEVEGFVVDGDALLEYLPEDFGLLINPESEIATIVKPALLSEIKKVS